MEYVKQKNCQKTSVVYFCILVIVLYCTMQIPLIILTIFARSFILHCVIAMSDGGFFNFYFNDYMLFDLIAASICTVYIRLTFAFVTNRISDSDTI